MNDMKAVDWLPLDAAIERLSHGYERAFLENVGPIALNAAGLSQAASPMAEQNSGRSDATGAAQHRRISLMGRMREWLRRVT